MKKIYSLVAILFFAANTVFAQPANDNPCFAIPLTVVAGTLLDEPCSTGTLYNHIAATVSTVTYNSGTTICYAGADVWFSVVVPSSGNLMLNTSESITGTSNDLTMVVFTATVCSGVFTRIACNDDGGDANIGYLNPIVRITGRTPGEVLFIKIAPLGGPAVANMSFRLCAKNLGTNVPPPISFSGFVGIGNPSPEGHLDVNGDVLVRRDFYIGRNSNFSGNATFNGNLTFNKNLTINQDATFKGKVIIEDSLTNQGFTRLGSVANGAPKIKMKKLIIPVGPAVDGFDSYPMGSGITDAKVIGVQIFVTYASPWKIPASYRDATGYEFNYQVQSNNIVIINKSGNSVNIGGKPFTVLITYEE
jgi:hypothetical protein